MQKALGIVGGMGPLATANFMTQVIENTDAGSDQEHLRIYVDCHSQVPDRVTALMGGGPDITPAIAESIKKLEDMGAGVLAMPCITAHAFYSKFVGHASVPFLYLPDIVAKSCMNDFPQKTAGVLSTAGTAKFRILLEPIEALNVPHITPDQSEQDEVSRLIIDVKMGKDMNKIAEDFCKILDAMMARGADYFVLGCTELPVIGNYCQGKYEFLDTTLELAKASILACGGRWKCEG